MTSDENIQKIQLISAKKWSGFEILLGNKTLNIQAKGYENIALIVFSLQFYRYLNRYLEENDTSELVMAIFTGSALLFIIYKYIIGERTPNKIEFNFKEKTLSIKSKNWLRRLFKKENYISFESIQEFDSVVYKFATRIFVISGEQKVMFLDVRNRKRDSLETLDSKTDGQILADCLENVILKK